MLQTVLASILLGAVANAGFASNVLDSIVYGNIFQLKIKAQKSVLKNSKAKIDFTGRWIGTCSDIIGSIPLEIEQSDGSILFNGQNFIFGAMTTKSSSGTQFYSNSQMRFTWDPTETVLILNSNYTQASTVSNNLFSIISETSFALNDDNLAVESKAVFLNNAETLGDTYKQTCNFTKDS